MSQETPGPGNARRPFSYGTVVGIVFVLIIIVVSVNALRSKDSGTVGIGEVGIGEPVGKFAVPVAASDLEGDANVDPDRACSVVGADVIRICDYFGKPLILSFWFTQGGSDCIEQQDTFEQLADKYRGRAGLLSVNVRDDRDRVRELIDEHGWRVPVGHDSDGAVSNLYRIGVCPTILFIRPDGTLKNAEIGTKSLPELDAQVRSLINDGAEIEPTNTQ